MVVQPGLCGTWSETPKTGFLTTRLILFPNFNLKFEYSRKSVDEPACLTLCLTKFKTSSDTLFFHIVVVLGFYVPPTAKVIWRLDLGFKSSERLILFIRLIK